LWKADLSDGNPFFSNASVGQDGTVYICNYTQLFAYDMSQNPGDMHVQPKWQSEYFETNVCPTPTIGNNGNIYIYTITALYAFSPTSTTSTLVSPLWRYSIKGSNNYVSCVSLGQEGTIFLSTFTYPTESSFNLYAIQPNGTLDVSYGNVSSLVVPCVGRHPTTGKDLVYVADYNTHSVVALQYNPGESFTQIFSTPLPDGYFNLGSSGYSQGFSLDANGSLYVPIIGGNSPNLYVFKDIPPSPIITSVITGDTTATIQFIQPTSRFPIVDYLYSLNGRPYQSSGGQGTVTLGNDPSITITGLHIHRNYTISIKAVNILGSPSAPSNTVPFRTKTPVCFGKGTDILCVDPPSGKVFYKKIEDIKEGDWIKTYKRGAKRVEEKIEGSLENNPSVWHQCMYRMRKRVGMTNDLWVTGGHSILVDSLPAYIKKRQIRMLGGNMRIEEKYMWLASECGLFERIENKKRYTYYHISLENKDEPNRKYGIWANGILTETASEREIRKNALIPGKVCFSLLEGKRKG
jgi:hypothetical protein